MKALAPLTLDLQPRPVHRSVPVMHANDTGGAVRTGTSQHILFCFGIFFVFIYLFIYLFGYSGRQRQDPPAKCKLYAAQGEQRVCFLADIPEVRVRGETRLETVLSRSI